MKPRFLLCPLLYTVLCLAACISVDGCNNGDIRLGDGTTPEWYGPIMNCEDGAWRSLAVCDGENDGPQWTLNNTEVACRELGFSSAKLHTFETYYENRYQHIPQCTGNEERLINCSTSIRLSNCNGFLSINITCVPFNITSTIAIMSPTQSPTVLSSSLITSQLIETSSVTSSIADLSTSSPVLSRLPPSPTPHSPPPPPSSLPIPLISLGVSFGVVILILLISIATVFICCKPHKRVKPAEEPYEIPLSTLERTNQTFDISPNTPETEVLYDRATTPSIHQYHTLTHSPTTTSTSNSQSTSSNYNDGYAIVGPPTPQSRDPPRERPPVYYHILQNPNNIVREEAMVTRSSTSGEQVQYHVLKTPGPVYHTLEQATTGDPVTMETGAPSSRAGGPVYSEVTVERRVTLRPVVTAHSDSNFTISLPRNVSGSTTLL